MATRLCPDGMPVAAGLRLDSVLAAACSRREQHA